MNHQQTLALDVEQRIRASFVHQGLIDAFNGKIVHVSSGEMHIEASFDKRFTRQDGFLHAGRGNWSR